MITVLHRQSILDLAIQIYGTAQAAFELALANGLAVSDAVEAGTVLLPIANPTHVNVDIQKYYAQRGILPATESNWVEPDYGIGEMIIGYNFIVR